MQDFAAMAQGAPIEEEQDELTQEDLEASAFSDEDYAESGLTPGQSPEAIKQRFLEMLQQAGVLDEFSDEEKKEIINEIDMYVDAMLEGDMQTVEASYLNKLLEQIGMDADPGSEDMPEQAQEQPAATKDFASMMPPSGGGLPGR